jgi:signal transduction histidine kinase/CheY-like chemotaxis protein/HPt (histidine-containing phosphotransfer) domain-containing protein
LLRDGADNPTHIVALVTDMTAGKLAEAELRRSIAETRAANEELDASRRAALNLMDDAVEARRLAEEASAELDRNRADLNRAQAVAHVGSWRLDVRRDELLWSEENHRIFGLPQGTPLTYETFLGVVHPDDRAYVDREWTAALGGAHYDIEHRILLGTEVKWVRERAELEFDAAGALLGGFGTTQDITEKKQVEEILQQAKAAAEAANEAKSRFLANISHELRTPMNAILGMVQLALQRQLDATAREFLTTARDSANVLLALLNDLLDSARIESGKLELETAPFSLRRMLDLTARVLEVRASEKGIAFSCRIADDVPDVYLGDELRLRQVLFNLTGNAVKFTERGEVTVDVRVASQDAQRACLEFAVRDTGIGISPADQERIFRPFAQADPSTTRRFGGTGLGLSISRSLVAMMDGRLWVESQLGQGSTFHFTVNLQWAGELVLEPAPEEIIAPVAAARLKLLLVEDNPANQKLAQFILRERGHEVEVVGDGARAVQLAAADCYDVILMDVQMPGMDGLEATAAIRQREAKQGLGIRDWGLVKEEPPTADSSPLILHPQSPIPSSPKFQSPIRLRRVPIIAMTAHAMAGDRERCLAAGMDGYLSKPIDGYEMIALVESLAGRKNLPQRRDAQSDGQLLDGDVGPMAAVSFSPGAPDGDVFLLEEAHRRCFNNPGMFREMVGYFFKECETVFDEMHAALAAGDWNGLGRLGHRLKGTVVYLGAPQASEAAKRVEQFGELPGRPADGAEAVAALAAQCEVLKAALVEHRPAVDETH